MKKIFLLLALMATFGLAKAQEAQTYPVSDTDQSEVVNAGADDKNEVATPSQQYVTAEDLRALLQLIDAKLSLLDKLSKLEALEAEVAAIKNRLNVPDANGIVSKGHEYVDLGITDSDGKTIYWATCNVGASAPEEYGLYYAWGSTAGYSNDTSDGHTFLWETDPFNGGNSSYSSTVWDEVKSSVVDASNNLLPANDAATANWGGSWRMPTLDEQNQLRTECYWEWVESYNGKSVNGYVVYKAKADADKGKWSYDNPTLSDTYSVSSDVHIFLPAAGYRFKNLLGSETSGHYWSSSLYSTYTAYASYLTLNSKNASMNTNSRYFGYTVRAVCQ